MLDARQIAQYLQAHDRDQDVSPSTLHYYVQVGILPPAVGRGRGSYTPEHLSRFRLARHMKRQGLGLAEIRDRVNRLSPEEVTTQLAALEPPAPIRYAAPAAQPLTLRDAPSEDAPPARVDTPRTLRFRGGYSLQVPAGTTDEQVAQLYAAIEATLNELQKDEENAPGRSPRRPAPSG